MHAVTVCIEGFFGFCNWASVTEVQVLCERLDLIHLIDKSKLDFFSKLCMSDNCVVTCCVKLSTVMESIKDMTDEAKAMTHKAKAKDLTCIVM